MLPRAIAMQFAVFKFSLVNFAVRINYLAVAIELFVFEMPHHPSTILQFQPRRLLQLVHFKEALAEYARRKAAAVAVKVVLAIKENDFAVHDGELLILIHANNAPKLRHLLLILAMGHLDDLLNAPDIEILLEFEISLLAVFAEVHFVDVEHFEEEGVGRGAREQVVGRAIEDLLDYLEFVHFMTPKEVVVNVPVGQLVVEGATVLHLLLVECSPVVEEVYHEGEA